MKLPKIVGRNQIEVETAEQLRTKFLQLCERSVAIVATHKVVVANVKRIGRVAIQQKDASWWIQRREKIFTDKWPISTMVKLGQDLGIIRPDDPLGW